MQSYGLPTECTPYGAIMTIPHRTPDGRVAIYLYTFPFGRCKPYHTQHYTFSESLCQELFNSNYPVFPQRGTGRIVLYSDRFEGQPR